MRHIAIHRILPHRRAVHEGSAGHVDVVCRHLRIYMIYRQECDGVWLKIVPTVYLQNCPAVQLVGTRCPDPSARTH